MVPLPSNRKVIKTHGSKSRNRQRNYNTLEQPNKHQQPEMQLIAWKNVFANYTSDREIISKAHKVLGLFYNNQLRHLKWTRHLSKHF